MGVGFVCYWPALLSLVSRTEAARVNATMMGIVYTSLFVANVIFGWMGGFYERMSAAGFWALHAAGGAVGGLILLVPGRRLDRALAPSSAATPS